MNIDLSKIGTITGRRLEVTDIEACKCGQPDPLVPDAYNPKIKQRPKKN